MKLKTGPRFILLAGIMVVAFIITAFAGFQLEKLLGDSNLFLDDGYLTNWIYWKYVCGFSALLAGVITFLLTRENP